MPDNCAAQQPSGADSARSWASRLANFKARGIGERDPRVQRCREALSYWRTRRVIDAELATLTDDDRADLAQRLIT